MKRFIRSHPLGFILLVAIALRLPAVIFSKGYMASDDQFETVEIAHRWTYGQVFYDDGIRMWPQRPANEHARFVLYNISLYSVMKLNEAVGINTLDGMMYSIRAIHAGISLLAVWAALQIVLLSTKSRRWAVFGGLAVAGYFLMPFLSVRNLIEMVGGNLWIVAVWLLYRYGDDRSDRSLIGAGVMTGLAWMIRFEIAFAALAIPFILWRLHRSPRPALVYTAAVFAMLLLSGVADAIVVDGFAASTVSHIRQVLTEPPPYQTVWYFYIMVLLGAFIPPFSLLLFGLVGNRKFLREHALLWIPTLVFIVAHTLSISRQERYLIPILPILLVIFVLAIRYHQQANGWLFRHRRMGIALLAGFLTINTVLLGAFTINYGHRGLVEPLVRMQNIEPFPAMVLVSPGRGRLMPFAYGGGIERLYRTEVVNWHDLDEFSRLPEAHDSSYFVVIHPHSDDEREQWLDSLKARLGSLTLVTHVGPSTIDAILHFLNPKHNRTHEAWVYRHEPQL
ncbi:MAG: glycosyltransferase family 39 protein [candidate division Zixibacteria bacterium]|jgi:hypothetical protein|nr:glycosyltransferase family 39 protein [candidate division Zixibacteria bacterium]